MERNFGIGKNLLNCLLNHLWQNKIDELLYGSHPMHDNYILKGGKWQQKPG